MAVIIVNIPNIAGESQMSGYIGQLEAVSLFEMIQLVSPKSSGSGGGVGRSQHSDIGLYRFRDKASPKLAEACSSGANLGTVTISLFRTVEAGPVAYMVYTLEQTMVSRIEYETLEENGASFLPHLGNASQPLPSGVFRPSYTELVPARQPLISMPASKHTNQEVERLWLNPAQVMWTYTPYTNGVASGSVSKTFSIERSVVV